MVWSALLAPIASALDLSEYHNDGPISAVHTGDILTIRWPVAEADASDVAEVRFDLRPEQPLIDALSVQPPGGERIRLLEGMEPLFLVTEAERDLDKRKGWVIFFDKTHKRPRKTSRLKLSQTRREFRVVSQDGRLSVVVGPVQGGSFKGELRFTFYPETALVHAAAEVRTEEPARAFLYDAGLGASKPIWDGIAWLDNRDQWQQAREVEPATAIRVRHRTVIAERGKGRVAVFPPPHRYFYPLDFSDNLGFAWHGRGLKTTDAPAGFGVRQEP
ncbi:MAG: hypothetical protein AAF492_13535, partial [Verrucomicrobiota bacterium]